jgi:hypothetical protein
MNISLQSPGLKSNKSKKPGEIGFGFLPGFPDLLFRLLFDSEHGNDMFFRNVQLPPNYKGLQYRKPYYS